MKELVERLADKVVEDFATEEDPDEKLWYGSASLRPMKDDLIEALTDVIADWLLEHKPVPAYDSK